MPVLAFDPGVTTGVAVVDDDGSIIETAAIAAEDFVVGGYALHFKRSYPDADVTAEAPPQQSGNYRFITQGVEEELKRVFPSITWVGPGQWKGHPAARPDSSLRGKTQHEKDAAGLGRWFRRTQLAGQRNSS